MRYARIFAAAALLVAAMGAQAGTISPALQARMDQVPADEPLSVIVNMTSQAPIASLNLALHARQATRQERHKEVVQALQSASSNQADLKSALDQGIRSGTVLGYTSYWISNLIVVQTIKSEIERIAARPDVDVVELNFKPQLIEPIHTPGGDVGTGTRGIGVTPGLRAIHAPQVWYQLGYNGAGCLIGGLDTGVDGSHPALATRWRGYNGAHPWQECWLDLLGNGTQFPVDNYGHGTHTMGTMTGLGAATQDTVGVAWGAKWIATNPIDQGVTPAFDNDIITAFQWFTDPDGNPNTVDDVPDVVQNSWGVNESFPQTPPYTDCDSRWWAVIDNCEAASVCVTWSAGNEGPGSGTLRSPADRATTFTNCFSVGAVDASNWQSGWPYPIASWSSRGPSGCNVPTPQRTKPEVCAPGVNVYSSIPGGGYSSNYSGTSMAGPHVAGTVALIRQANPNLDVDSIKQILMDTARDEGTTGEDNNYGWGFIDAYAAVVAATVGFGNIEGHVTNSYNGVPVAGAQVQLVETGVHFTTDGTGYYTGSAAAASYTVQCSRPGFETATANVTITSNETTVQDFSLIDNAGPEITNVTQIGPTEDTVGPYVINASIFDYSSVAQARLYYSVNHGAFTSTAMTQNLNTYTASIPGMPAGTEIDYYVWAQDGLGHASTDPAGAPGSFYSIFITETAYSYTVEDPEDPNWVLGMPGDGATAGLWNRVVPIGSVRDGEQVHPATDHTPDPGTMCFLTGNGPSYADGDVDGGCTTLRSPIFDLSAANRAFLTYYRWYAMLGTYPDDSLHIDVSSNGGSSWTSLELLTSMENNWTRVAKDLGQYITLTDQVCFRVKACDFGHTTTVVAGLDDISMDVFTPNSAGISESGWTHKDVSLSQNRPNPFRPAGAVTTINFTLSNAAPASLEIFDTAGRLVRTLFQGPLASGAHSIGWDGLDDQGHTVSAGMYFYRLKAGAFEQSRRMTILR